MQEFGSKKSRITSYDMKSLFTKGYLKNIFEGPVIHTILLLASSEIC